MHIADLPTYQQIVDYLKIKKDKNIYYLAMVLV